MALFIENQTGEGMDALLMAYSEGNAVRLDIKCGESSWTLILNDADEYDMLVCGLNHAVDTLLDREDNELERELDGIDVDARLE